MATVEPEDFSILFAKAIAEVGEDDPDEIVRAVERLAILHNRDAVRQTLRRKAVDIVRQEMFDAGDEEADRYN